MTARSDMTPAPGAPHTLRASVVLLVLIVMLFTGAGLSIPFIHAHVVDRIEKSSRFEPIETLVHLDEVLARLQAAAALHEIEHSARSGRALRVAMGVVKSRLPEFQAGQLGDLIAADPQRRKAADEIEADVGEFERRIADPDPTGLAQAARALVDKIDEPLSDLSGDIVSESSRLVSDDHAEMFFSQRIQSLMLVGVVASGFGLIIVVSRQNARLKRAHEEQTRLTERFAHIALRDPLTGLFNRNGFAPEVEAASERAKASGAEVALLTLDLDKFKVVNDVFSHATGDAILKSVAERLQAIDAGGLRTAIARLGGDEFAMMIEGPHASRRALEVAEKIVRRIREPHEIGRLTLSTDTSIGVAHSPDHGTEAADLMLSSDIALYRAKAEGRGVTRVYRQSEGSQRLGRATLEARLADAIAAREFVPLYQPQVDFRTGRIVAVETLIRWRYKGVLIAPIEFLPFAEATGLIVELDRALLGRLCEELPNLPPDIRVSFNLSAAQMFCEDVIEGILGPIRKAGLDPRRLEVEITETTLLANVQRVSQVMAILQHEGLSIALDDFGSGYSSLGYLRRFPFDKLKIDKMFVEDLSENSQAFAILKTIVALGRAFEQTVVAEGVETAEQARIVQLAGCYLGQGYFMSRPVPMPDLLRQIAERNPTRLSA